MGDDSAARARELFERGLLSRGSFAIWGGPCEEDADCLLCRQPIAARSMCIEEVNKAGSRFYFHPRCHLVVMTQRHGA